MMPGKRSKMRARLPGINTVRKVLADGSARYYYYHRHTRTRLSGAPGSAEFVASFATAEKKLLERDAGQCAGLIRAYLSSPEFTEGLAASTQKEYRRVLTAVETKFGTMPIDAMSDHRFVGDVLEWRDEIATTKPRQADNRMIIFGLILAWGKKRHKIEANVLEGYERVYRTDRSDKIWLPEQIAVMQKLTRPEFWPMFLAGLHTGLR